MATLTETASIGPAEQGNASLPPLNATQIQLSARLMLTVRYTQSKYQMMPTADEKSVRLSAVETIDDTTGVAILFFVAPRSSQIAATLLDFVACRIRSVS